MTLDVNYVLGKKNRVAIGKLPSPFHPLQGPTGCATGFTIIGAATTGKNSGEWIEEPIGEWSIAAEVSVSCHLAHYVPVVDNDTIYIIGKMDQWVNYHA